jgi:hypothetical protein
MIAIRTKPSFTLITLLVPGPDRKRTLSPYHYRLNYRNSDPDEVGCVATWEVLGGREEYQISLELTEEKELLWHCDCADAVYRGDSQKDYQCKHIHGLKSAFEVIATPHLQPVAA